MVTHREEKHTASPYFGDIQGSSSFLRWRKVFHVVIDNQQEHRVGLYAEQIGAELFSSFD
ncbi:hypothetical protein AUR04nite_34840 [Glutamicibacter uratoxydans]|uniref:Uncharacterized protein n=1 Tax=Glutamicibacter uratoxydans TaxID=43667 RepID=A0A4Y4DRH8_GLUUR|nr:hypothetical protein AUR04nite_34840 [Glutamicibacter uratoxydans]